MGKTGFLTDVIRKTTGEIRTFLDELSNDTANYRTVHNLTEQVTHEYDNRFLIELIQNAHDVLHENPDLDSKSRIAIIIERDETPFGSLYVANDGAPFSPSNFTSLSRLGQSDKDPQKSIGHKGIGFRSVLEITSEPEIYSRTTEESSEFDGFCFRFSPSVSNLFEAPILELLRGNDVVVSPLGSALPLVEWGAEKKRSFRTLHGANSAEWLRQELSFLSPYLLPLPLGSSDQTSRLQSLQSEGYSTVIRLPFKDEAASELASSLLANLNANTALFLSRLTELRLEDNSDWRIISRTVQTLNDVHGGKEVTLAVKRQDELDGKMSFLLWEDFIGGINNPQDQDEIAKSVADLGGRWPEVRSAMVSLAVRIDETPEEGFFNIYLPTTIPTGCAAHISAPFFAHMNRKSIDFSKDYNKLLLRRIAKKALDVALVSLAGKGLDEARAIVDILAPFNESQESKYWFDLLMDEIKVKGIELKNEQICLTDQGWSSLVKTSILPLIDSPKVITEEILRSNASFTAFVAGLTSRQKQLKAVFKQIDVGPYPSIGNKASTVEKIAGQLHDNTDKADWNGYWADLMAMFDKNQEALKERKIILGNDGELHASGINCAVFFIPQQGMDDDEDLGEAEILTIPPSLRGIISFLADSLQVIDERDARKNTPLYEFLVSGLVQKFRRETILNKVLLPHVPKLPVKLSSQEGLLCRDIMFWGLKLVAGMPDRGKGRKSIAKLLADLPAPCRGGWFKFSEASFGLGWENTAGTELLTYLQGVDTPFTDSQIDKLLQSPRSKHWQEQGRQFKDLISSAGVYDGLRPLMVAEGSWVSEFIPRHSLPEKKPPFFSQSLWSEYSNECDEKASYRYPTHSYKASNIWIIPGVEKYDSFDESTRLAFMRLVLKSLPHWGDDWKEMSIDKIAGLQDTLFVESPLSYYLRKLPWLGVIKSDHTEWAAPGTRWYIPKAQMQGKSWQFAHLNPLPGAIADEIDRNPQMETFLCGLGMPKFDPDSQTSSPRLLEDLAKALESGDIPDRNVFIGHLRMAWNIFRPSAYDILPAKLIVTQGNNELQVFEPSEDNPFYLPNTAATFINALTMCGLPVVEIETPDAKVLAEMFKLRYAGSIKLAADLIAWPSVEGKKWQAGECELLTESELRWVAPVVLSLFAHAGNQPSGAHTKRFSEAVQAVREAHICWVESLQVGLWRDGEEVTTRPVPALWLSEEKTLVCDLECNTQFSLLSEALETMVKRGDLDISLKLVLGKLEHLDVLSIEDIQKALSGLNIKPHQFMFVNEHWKGDISQTVRMVMPVMALLCPQAPLGDLAEVNSDVNLYKFINNQHVQELNERDWRTLLKSCEDFYSLGLSLYKNINIGDSAELSEWNRALLIAAEKQLINKDVDDQCRQHITRAFVPLNAALAHVLLNKSEIGAFKDCSEQIEALQFPVEWAGMYWHVPFQKTMQVVQDLFASWGAPDEILYALGSASSIEELVVGFVNIGFEPGLDPFDTRRINRDICFKVMFRFQRIAIAWCLKQKLSPLLWEKSPDDFVNSFWEQVDSSAYLKKWDENICFALMKTLARDSQSADFWVQVDIANSIEGLIGQLLLTQEELDQAQASLEAYMEKKRQQNRIVQVCGKDFDNSEDNLTALWNHIESSITEDALSEIKLNQSAVLKDVKKIVRKRKEPGAKPNAPKQRGRISKSMENLIGLFGEIHAYRMLRKTYGEQVVNKTSWISSNSTKVYSDNKPDDGYGCDFVLSVKNRRYFIEVKATQGTDDSFEMGSSEVELAMEMTKKSNNRKGKFLIVHVTNALSNTPECRVLNNPFDQNFQRYFSIDNAGVRIRYKRD